MQQTALPCSKQQCVFVYFALLCADMNPVSFVRLCRPDKRAEEARWMWALLVSSVGPHGLCRSLQIFTCWEIDATVLCSNALQYIYAEIMRLRWVLIEWDDDTDMK